MTETPSPSQRPQRSIHEIRVPKDRPVREDPQCPGHPDRRQRCVRDGLCLMSCGCVISGCTTSYSGIRVLEGRAKRDLYFCDVHGTWMTIVEWVTVARVVTPVRPKDCN